MKPVFIAEIGLNHGGSLSKAFRMIDLCKQAGADIVKFQYYSPVEVLGHDHPALDYAARCQFSQKDHERLKKHCDEIGVEYMVSVFNVRDVEWAASLCKRMKIASRMNENLEFLSYVERTKLPVIMSIQVETPLRRFYRDRFYLMWCVRNYPSTPTEALNFPFSYKYGLSSHCPDYKVTVEAFQKGARIFENHVKETMDEEGCDMSSSITIDSFARMVKEINALNTALAAD